MSVTRWLAGLAVVPGGVAVLGGCNLGVPAVNYPVGVATDPHLADLDGDGDTDVLLTGAG